MAYCVKPAVVLMPSLLVRLKRWVSTVRILILSSEAIFLPASPLASSFNTSFSFLVPKSEKIEPWILKSKKYAVAFLAGYVDAEGSFGLNNRNQSFFSMKSQDKEVMYAIQSHILPLVGIQTKLHFVRAAGSVMNNIRCNKDVFGIFIYNRKALGKILSPMLPLLKHAKRKNDALKVFNHIKNVRS